MSVYEYTDISGLQDYAAETYSGRSSSYTDNVINAVITQSERMINTHMHTTYSGTIPDAVTAVANELSYRLMFNRLLVDGIIDREIPPKPMEAYITKDLEAILFAFKAGQSRVSNVPLYEPYNYWNVGWYHY